MADLPDHPLSRRSLLAGGLAIGATGLLTACGGSSRSSGSAASDPGAASQAGTNLIAFFQQQGGVVRTAAPQRLVFGVGTADGALVKQGPAELTFTVRTTDGSPVGEPIVAQLHQQGLPRGYYPVTVDIPSAGNYQVTTTLSGKPASAAFRVDDPSQVPFPQVGQKLPDVQTPTTADHRGVDPICTAQPQCPLHGTSLADVLAAPQKPIALLVATPAFCQVAICGPVLDVLLSQQAAYGQKVEMIHVEVYKSGQQAAENLASAQLAPAVEALQLPFEPCLFLTSPDGTVVERLDNIFDERELGEALARLTA